MNESLRLFLIEDDEDIALLIRKTLERAGNQVTTCRTGADALMVLGQTSFNLVILDLWLQDMNGLELLKTLNQEGISTPILIITARGDEHQATQVLQSGALDYVVKDEGLTFLVELPKRIVESVARYQLQETNRLLVQALESTKDGVMITDLQGEILNVNRALEDLMGYSRPEMLGETPRLFKSGLQTPEFYANMWHTVLSRKSWQGEIINRRKDGTFLDLSVTISPVFDSREQMTHFVGIYRDIRDRKQLERQLLQAQKLQSVGTLAGGIAHEFNNLLAGIQGYAALGLREPDLSFSAREFFQFIVELTDRAAGLTRQLLAFARKPALSRQPTRMDQLLISTVELVRHSVSLDVELNLPNPAPDVPLLALADANQLQQVLVNLALNARDAIKSRDSRDLTTTREEGNLDHILFTLDHVELSGEQIAFPENVPMGDYVVLQVRDKGTGMTPDVLSQAFDPFFTTKGVGQGTGLGLPVAFGIVRGHQGYLTIESTPQQGTCVSIYLPRLTTTGQEAFFRNFEGGEVLEPEKVIGRNILVIDDEEAVLDVIRRFLRIAGHQVICVTSGKLALDRLKEGQAVDLIILDLMVPREEGTKTFRLLRETRPHLPILLCTGLLQAESPFAGLIKESAGVLRKPFKMNELWYMVNQVFSTDS